MVMKVIKEDLSKIFGQSWHYWVNSVALSKEKKKGCFLYCFRHLSKDFFHRLYIIRLIFSYCFLKCFGKPWYSILPLCIQNSFSFDLWLVSYRQSYRVHLCQASIYYLGLVGDLEQLYSEQVHINTCSKQDQPIIKDCLRWLNKKYLKFLPADFSCYIFC